MGDNDMPVFNKKDLSDINRIKMAKLKIKFEFYIIKLLKS